MTFEKLVDSLKNESSTNAKIDLLKEVENNDNIKTLLHMTYDPFKKFYVKKMPKIKINGTLSVEETFDEFNILCDRLSKRKLTGNAARDALEMFLVNCNVEARKCYELVLKKDLKVGISDKSINKAFGQDFIETFSVQLAYPYSHKRKYDCDYWYASRKLDGLRCYYTKGQLLTRNGHDIIGFDNITKELDEIMNKYNLDFVDGELFTREVNFQAIQGAVMSYKNIDPVRKSKVKYHIFAIGHKDFKETSDMANLLRKIFSENKFEFLVEVTYSIVKNDPHEIDKQCEKYMEEGFEGVMLRHPERWYVWKRSHDLVKHKLFIEYDFEITGYYAGEEGTKIEHTLGGLIIAGQYINEEKGIDEYIVSEVGSGFDDETRDILWNMKDDLKGMTTEIKFQNITDEMDPKTGYYSLRFPVFNKLKMDR